MIDAHFHIWSLVRGDYAWLTPALAPIYRDVSVTDWQVQARGMKGGVLVQAAPSEAETAFLLAQARLHSVVKGVVGWIDMLAPDAVVQVERLARDPLLKGLRPMLQDLLDPEWILQPAITKVLHAMSRCGLVFDALIFPLHLPRIQTLIQRHPDLTVVIDHGAKPTMAPGATQAWTRAMETLAQQTDPERVVCKLSGLWTQAEPASDCEAVIPWCNILLQCWSPQRLMWGSDWPVVEMRGTYQRWLEISLQVLRHLSVDEQVAVFGGNAQRVYRL